MKKLFLIACIALLSTASFAKDSPEKPEKEKQVNSVFDPSYDATVLTVQTINTPEFIEFTIFTAPVVNLDSYIGATTTATGAKNFVLSNVFGKFYEPEPSVSIQRYQYNIPLTGKASYKNVLPPLPDKKTIKNSDPLPDYNCRC